jgi:hypothetical protein
MYYVAKLPPARSGLDSVKPGVEPPPLVLAHPASVNADSASTVPAQKLACLMVCSPEAMGEVANPAQCDSAGAQRQGAFS